MTGPEPSCWVVLSVERRVADTSMLCVQLFNIMTCKEEARRLKGSGVEVFVAHPGLSTTDHFGKVRHPAWGRSAQTKFVALQLSGP